MIIFNGNFGTFQKCIHLLLISLIWIISIIIIKKISRTYFYFNEETHKNKIISKKDWIIIFLCLLACKILTFIDWNTLKVIGEFNIKGLIYFSIQYVYYFIEVALICHIIAYGQKAFEVLFKKKQEIPFGGFVLGFTWGTLHFISRGSLDIWNGISCIIFSILSGTMYLKLNRNRKLSYIFIALGYLL